MWKARRAVWLLLSAGMLTCLVGFLASLAQGQVLRRGRPVQIQFGFPQPPTIESGSTAQYSAIKLVEKSEYRQFINVAQDCIKDKAWNDAVTALQTILDNKEDFYVKIKERDAHGRETVRWTSVKIEANNLLGTMPLEGLDVYEVRFGGKARQLLDEARRKGEWDLLAEVAQRYLHTRAGTQANDLLATFLLDRGQFFSAALRYERLLKMNPQRVKVSDLTLFKTALAFRRAGETKKAEDFWKLLEPRLREQGGLKVGDGLATIAQLQQVLNEIPRPEPTNPHDWPLIRGNITNSAQATGSPPLLDMVLWQRPTVLDRSDVSGEEPGKEAKVWIDRAIEQQNNLPGSPVLPGFFPIAAGNLLIYRSYLDVKAVYLQDEKDGQGKVMARAGEIAWKTTEFEGSLAMVLSDADLRGTLDNNWLTTYSKQPGLLNLVYENTMLGTLATDHRLVYAVDDLAVPAPNNIFQYTWNNMWNTGQVPAKVKPLVLGNSLRAFELSTGLNKWHLGGKPLEDNADKDPFIDSHFLSVPLAVGGKLYVLNEKNPGATGDSELRLVCIDPTRIEVGHRPRVLSIQALGSVQQQHRVTHDLSRRINGVQLAYADGILVCPTNAGEVLGFDLLSRSLAWSYPYREAGQQVNQQPMPFPGAPVPSPNPIFNGAQAAKWKSSPPVIQEGKVVFTAPDAGSLHCINLHNGVLSWKSPRLEGDLFLAGVFQGKVLIVGKNGCRALNLADGTQRWYLPTGDMPSGQGVACKNIYYLPLRKGEITAIDLARGVIKAHNRATKSGIPPGNLVFHEGVVVSQTPREILAYPQLVARLELANAAVKADPNNPDKLVDRGEIRLFDGMVQEAVEDLRLALGKNPSVPVTRKARERLYEAYTNLFQLDFNNASPKYLDEFRELCQVSDNPEEEQQRKARFLRIVAQGRETQGNLVEAFQLYREFGDLPINREQGVAAVDDPSHRIPTPVWLRGRISAMMAKAVPQQRQPLEIKIAEEWKVVQAKDDIDAIRTFVGMFDVPFKVGREARLKLAEAILVKNDQNAFLEAELNLGQLRGAGYRQDPAVGGRALAALALLEERKGHAELAAAYYRELGRDFAALVVRGDKTTGADLVNELATDKRFLPYLEEPGSLWGQAKIAAREVPAGQVAQGLQGFIFHPEGDLTSLMKNHRLVLDPTNSSDPKVRLVDLTTNTVRWTQNLGTVPANFNFFQYLYQQSKVNNAFLPNARFRFFQAKGHLGVFQVGTMVYALDLDSSRILWQHSLLPDKQNLAVQQILPDPQGNLEILVANQFGQYARIRLGQVGAVQASYVALVTQKGLVVLDPLRGTPLWSKMDVQPQSQVFGDDQHIFLVQVSQGGGMGAGRVMRASDGVMVEAPDFGPIYQNRVRILGQHILAAVPAKEGLTLRLYDILAGKDRWTRTFGPRATVLQTEDPNLTGVIEPEGKLVALDVLSGKELLSTSVLQGRVKSDDFKNLHEPLLLRDGERFFLALNTTIDSSKVAGGIIGNNFSNGLRCAVVNGWFLAFQAADGKRQSGDRLLTWKKGDLAWHSFKPIFNQMIVLEQLQNMPVILFTSRYNEIQGINGTRWVTATQSLRKKDGRLLWDTGLQPSNSSPLYYAFTIDLRAGTINMISFNGTLQHYVDDGRKTVQNQPGGVGLPDPGGPGRGARFQLPGAAVPGVFPAFPNQRGVFRAMPGNIRIWVVPGLPAKPPVPIQVVPQPPAGNR